MNAYQIFGLTDKLHPISRIRTKCGFVACGSVNTFDGSIDSCVFRCALCNGNLTCRTRWLSAIQTHVDRFMLNWRKWELITLNECLFSSNANCSWRMFTWFLKIGWKITHLLQHEHRTHNQRLFTLDGHWTIFDSFGFWQTLLSVSVNNIVFWWSRIDTFTNLSASFGTWTKHEFTFHSLLWPESTPFTSICWYLWGWTIFDRFVVLSLYIWVELREMNGKLIWFGLQCHRMSTEVTPFVEGDVRP